MNILVLDDEVLELNSTKEKIEKLVPEAAVHAFSSSRDTLEFVRNNSLDIAILDVELDTEINGVNIASEIKMKSPKCNVIFATGFKQYAFDAVGVRASGYLIKPISIADLKRELANLRVPLVSHKLKVVTFGSFDVYDENNKHVNFSRKTNKEVFAYLIDRHGSEVTTKQICMDVFERDFDLSESKIISTYLHDLQKDLEKAGYPDVVIKEKQTIKVDIHQVDCDYYKLLDGDKSVLKAFHDEYMSNYSWAEPTCSNIMDMMEED